jgi:hypothetical protein
MSGQRPSFFDSYVVSTMLRPLVGALALGVPLLCSDAVAAPPEAAPAPSKADATRAAQPASGTAGQSSETPSPTAKGKSNTASSRGNGKANRSAQAAPKADAPTQGAGDNAARGTSASTAPAASTIPPPERIDTSKFLEELKILSDGKGHYIAVVPWGEFRDEFYYGDAQALYRQRVFGYSAEDKVSFDRYFWEPRMRRGGASFEFRDGKYTVECGDRKASFTPVADEEQQRIRSTATFAKTRWKHRAYALSRDERGNYYYVDKVREPEESKVFRLWAGPKGAMKLQKMTNIVSDSAGDIFSTKGGELRLILGGQDAQVPKWIQGKSEEKLTFLPVENNARLIYEELGVYVGESLGTPCDDL